MTAPRASMDGPHDKFCACAHCERQVTAHDPLCPTQYLQRATCHYCHLIARARFDELTRTVPKCERCQRLWMRLDDAEAVAARLVEVICEDDVDRQDSYSVQVWRAEVVRDETRAQIAQEVRDGCHHWRNDIKPCLTCGPIADRIARGDA